VESEFCPDLSAVHEHVGTLPGYLRDSVRQGEALVLLRQRYPDEVSEPTARYISGRFPMPARLLVSLTLRYPDNAGAAVCGSLLVISYLAGVLRLWRVQRLLVVLLRRVGQARGVGTVKRSQRSQKAAPDG
jgi:hypothetical protein